jgi:cytochrome o ubiquinol oxidase operon protein cyoD
MQVRHTPVVAEPHTSLGKYILGYVASLVLTLAGLAMVVSHTVHGGVLLLGILLLAVLQVVVQLFWFMHVTEGDGPAWHSVAIMMGFFFTIIIVASSIWIMSFHNIVS